MRTLPGDTLECEIDMQDENHSILSISDDMASLYEENMLHMEDDRHQKNISSREEKVIRILEMLKDERLSLIDLIEVIFSSQNASIRPFADKFFANARLELALTTIIDRAKAKRASLDAWIIQMASSVLSRQLSSLCTQLRRPTSTYDRESLLSWTVSSAETLVRTFSPGLYTLLHGLGPPNWRTLLNRIQDESTHISSNPQRAESPLTEVDRFGCAVQDDAHAGAADSVSYESGRRCFCREMVAGRGHLFRRQRTRWVCTDYRNY